MKALPVCYIWVVGHKYRKLSHSFYYCVYHIVWTPKYRFRVLRDIIADAVEDKIRTISQWQEVEVGKKKYRLLRGGSATKQSHVMRSLLLNIFIDSQNVISNECNEREISRRLNRS